MWVIRMKYKFSARTANVFSQGAISPAPGTNILFIFFKTRKCLFLCRAKGCVPEHACPNRLEVSDFHRAARCGCWEPDSGPLQDEHML